MAPKQAFGITNSCFIQQYFRGSVMQNKPCNPEQDSPSAIVCVDLNIRCTFCVCVCVYERVYQSACSCMVESVVYFFCCLGPQSLTHVCMCFLKNEYLNNFLNNLPTAWTRSLELVQPPCTRETG